MRNKLNYIFNLCLTLSTKVPLLCIVFWKCLRLIEAYQTHDWLTVLRELVGITYFIKKVALSKSNNNKK